MKYILTYYRSYAIICLTMIFIALLLTTLNAHVDLIEINPDIAIETSTPKPIYEV